MTPPTVADVVAALDALYDPRWAEPWDAVGLVCGDPAAPVRRVLLAVDPVEAVADEALEWGADLLLVHHPLYLRGTTSVAATTAKGRLVHRLITGGVALHVAHTNADVAAPGVSDALADALGLVDVEPLVPGASDPRDKVITFVPHADAERVVDALSEAGAGEIGDYTRCAYTSDGTGTFRPEHGARPVIGTVGRVATVPETRVEMVLPRGRRAAVVAALRAAHPYEEPPFDVVELADLPSRRGLGRVGHLPAPEAFDVFVDRVAAAVPATPAGIRAAGPGDRQISRVAVVGGAGDSVFPEVRRSGADAYVTADLRHHPASEALGGDSPCLVDAGHWASEWPWLADAAARLVTALSDGGTTVETRVSTRVTDPWTRHAATTTTTVTGARTDANGVPDDRPTDPTMSGA